MYGLRPTTRRVPLLGTKGTRMGYDSMESVLGPLSRTLEGIVAFVKLVADGKSWELDPTVIEIPWRQEMFLLKELGGIGAKKLAFGIYKWDGVIMPHPPIQRAINMVIDALKQAGHEGRKTIFLLKPYGASLY